MAITPEAAVAASAVTKFSVEEQEEVDVFVKGVDAVLSDHFDGFCMVITAVGDPKILAAAARRYVDAGWRVEVVTVKPRPTDERGTPLIGSKATFAMELRPRWGS